MVDRPREAMPLRSVKSPLNLTLTERRFRVTAFSLSLLGGFSLTADGAPVALSGRKDRLLMAYLALKPGLRHRRETLYTLLWGERGEEQARASLRQSLTTLRDAFRPFGTDPIAADRETVMLLPDLIACDALLLEDASAAASPPAEVITSSGGELLAGLDSPSAPFADWLAGERQRIDGVSARLLERAVQAGQHGEAAEALAQRLLRRDPLLESAHLSMMKLLMRRGERAGALKAYASCKAVLQKELGVPPSFAIEQYYRDIVSAAPAHEPGTAPEPQRPVLAVMPFDAAGQDATLLTLGEALAEEVTGGLGRFRQFDMIDRNSTAAVAKLHQDTAEIGRMLGASLLLRGSLQHRGERLRVSVTLIETATRHQLWSEAFERDAEEVLSIPDAIARAIVATLHARVENSLIERSDRKPKLAAYECVLKGVRRLRMVGHEHNAAAVQYFDEAIRLDPGYALARAYRAFGDVVLHGYNGAPPEILLSARERGEAAVAMDPDCARCHWLLGMTYGYLGDIEADKHQHERSLALNPYDANVLASYGVTMSGLGQPEKGIQLIREAMRLNPYHPEWYWVDLGSVLYVAGRYADAIEAYRHNTSPKVWVLARLAACYAQLGQAEDASKAVAAVLRQNPGFRLSQQRSGSWSPTDQLHFQDGFRKAGLPE